MDSRDYFSDLPHELHLTIFQHLEDITRDDREELTSTLLSLAQVSHHIRATYEPILFQPNGASDRALRWGAFHGLIPVMEKALYHGASIKAEGPHPLGPEYTFPTKTGIFTGPGKGSPLHFAAMNGQNGAVKWLLDHGASLHEPSKNLCKCVDPQIPQGFLTDLGRISQNHGSLNHDALSLALCHRHSSTAQLLIDHGALEGNAEVSALHTAAATGQHDLFFEILRHVRRRVSSDAPIESRFTALHYAACSPVASPTFIQQMVKAGAHLIESAPRTDLPVFYAALNGSWAVATMFLDVGLDMTEAQAQLYRTAGISLEGALVHAAAFAPEPPSELPTSSEWFDGRKRFLERLARQDPNCVNAIYRNAHWYTNDTPLKRAAAKSRVELVRILLDLGADPNVTAGACSETVLHALTRCNLPVYPDDNPTRVSHPNYDFYTCQIENIATSVEKRLAATTPIIIALLEHGASVDGVKDRDGKTPMDLVIRYQVAERADTAKKYIVLFEAVKLLRVLLKHAKRECLKDEQRRRAKTAVKRMETELEGWWCFNPRSRPIGGVGHSHIPSFTPGY
ncbi:ankyrin repeat-containing domain protein [Sordaria brevicollis]|uniref:Ankyrin repeat-containing domain protein n=1 Tax=Sordaria brevicollis TaxID=83679 RepID=A0AAE0NVF1_SORBR|nr:ankyrin repeat-containing domain protein [Sordaria brevicollis]